MSYLENAKKSPPQAPIITIVGFPGVGKSSLAALFPNPIFIQAENASSVFETWDDEVKPVLIDQLPTSNKNRALKTSAIIREQLLEIATVEHNFKTLVIDSVTALNELFEREIVEFDSQGAQNIGEACGGFNKGYKQVAIMHAEVRRMCEHIRKKGIAVVFLAHTGVQKIKNRPDGGEYVVFTIDMPLDSRSVYINHSDAVVYVKAEEFVTGTDTNKKGQVTKYGRITSTGNRIAITSSDGTIGYTDAKNRYDMPNELQVAKGENPLMQFIPFFKQQ